MDNSLNQLVEAARARGQTAAVGLIEHFYERVYAFRDVWASNEADAADLHTAHLQPGLAGAAPLSREYWVPPDSRHRLPCVCGLAAGDPDQARSEQQVWWSARPAPTFPRTTGRPGADPAATLATPLFEQLSPDLRESVHLHYYQAYAPRDRRGDGRGFSTVKYRLRLP